MKKNKKNYILIKTKNILELVSINGINIANMLFVNYGSNLLIENNYSKPTINACRFFLTAGILSVNLAYTNYNMYNNKLKCNQKKNQKK